jgi:hypothetical protein
MDDPWMVSTSGRPRPGSTSARVSMACTTRVWVASVIRERARILVRDVLMCPRGDLRTDHTLALG